MALTFEWDFPSGQCDPVDTTIANPDAIAPVVFVGMRYTAYRHWAIKLNGALGKRPIIEFDDTNNSGQNVDSGWRAWYTEDDPGDVNAVWKWWDTNWTRSGTINTGQLSTAFTSNTVYVSFQPLHTLARNLSHIQKIKAEYPSYVHQPPCVSSINSADWAMGYTDPWTDYEGRAQPALPMRAFRVTDLTQMPADGKAKRKVVLTSGIHAGEHSSGWTFEGILSVVLSSTTTGANLRKNFDFYCYPNINPQGRYEGYKRQTSAGGGDMNRDWGSNLLTDGPAPVVMVKIGIDQDIPDTKISANFDCHTAQYGGNTLYWYRDSVADPAYYNAFHAAMNVYKSYGGVSNISDNTLNNYLFRKYDSQHCYIPEVKVESSFPNGIPDILFDGENIAKALNDLYYSEPAQFGAESPVGEPPPPGPTTFSIDVSSTSRILTSLVEGADYEWRIRSTDGAEVSAFSSWSSFTVVEPPPAAPSGYINVGTVTSKALAGLEPNTTYEWRIKSTDETSQSAYSAWEPFTTITDGTTLGASSLKVTNLSNTITRLILEIN